MASGPVSALFPCTSPLFTWESKRSTWWVPSNYPLGGGYVLKMLALFLPPGSGGPRLTEKRGLR